jgi:hypothetical protein
VNFLIFARPPRDDASPSGEPWLPERRVRADATGFVNLNVCDKLAVEDLAHFDADGSVAVAYPFSGRPTSHRVLIDGHSVHAMCAIDALGIAPMFDRTSVVSSRDPITEVEISVWLQPDGSGTWQPGEAVDGSNKVLLSPCCP